MRLSLRLACLPLTIVAIPAAANAQADASAVARFNECAAIQTDADRLACFDRVTREVRANAATQAQTQAQNQQNRVKRERDDFGLSVVQRQEKRPSEPKGIGELTARVAASRRVGPGYYAIMLEDGAVWQVEELDPYFRPPNPGDTIKIRKRSMGSYLLYVGKQASVRVRRLS